MCHVALLVLAKPNGKYAAATLAVGFDILPLVIIVGVIPLERGLVVKMQSARADDLCLVGDGYGSGIGYLIVSLIPVIVIGNAVCRCRIRRNPNRVVVNRQGVRKLIDQFHRMPVVERQLVRIDADGEVYLVVGLGAALVNYGMTVVKFHFGMCVIAPVYSVLERILSTCIERLVLRSLIVKQKEIVVNSVSFVEIIAILGQFMRTDKGT